MDLSDVTAAPSTIEVGGKTWSFSRLTLRDWGKLEMAALQAYRREYLETRLQNADLLADNGDVDGYKAKVVAEAMELQVADLPQKEAKLTKFDEKGEIERDKQGDPVTVKQTVEYPMWWFNETMDGRLHAIFLSLCKLHPEVTLDTVDEIIMSQFSSAGLNAITLADMVGEISTPSGNSPEPSPDPNPDLMTALNKTTDPAGEITLEQHAKERKKRRRRSRT